MLFGFIEWVVKVARIFAWVVLLLVLIGAFLGARWSLAQIAQNEANAFGPLDDKNSK